MHWRARSGNNKNLAACCAGAHILCFLNTLNARTLKLQKTNPWLGICEHQNSKNVNSVLKTCFLRGSCAHKQRRFQAMQESGSRTRNVKNKTRNHAHCANHCYSFSFQHSEYVFVTCAHPERFNLDFIAWGSRLAPPWLRITYN